MKKNKKHLIIDNGLNKMRRIIFMLFLTFSSLFSQDPNWNSSIIFPQYPSPYFSDWERNPNIGTFTLNYFGTAPVEFYFEVIVNVDGYGEAIKGRTAMREYLSGPQMQVLTFNDISDWESTTYNKDLERIVAQSGKLPESTYSICVTTHAKDGTLLTDACTDFDIALPNPPQLISPENEGSIEIAQPTLMWNPVSTPPEIVVYYQLKIVEMLDGQSAYRAIEANIPVVETEIPVENLYVYRLDDYPLKQNHSYAWQVKATNSEGVPVSTNEGFSEIWQFTYGSPAGELGIDTLVLIEDFAYLFDLNQLNITDNNSFLNLDGSCRMLLKGLDGVDKYVDVFAQNLMLQKDEESYEKPVFLGGNVLGSIYNELFSKGITGEFFKPTELEFTPPNQFNIGGNFYLGEQVDLPLNGKLSYIDGELSGELLLMGDATSPVFGLGDDSFKLNITSLSLSYPSIETNLQGGLTVFGTPSACNVDKINLKKDGTYNAKISCDINQEIAMLQGSSLFVLNVNSVEGGIKGNLLTDDVDYKVVVNGGLNFNVNPENSFGADVVFELMPNKFNLISFEPTADVDASVIDFGWVKWDMQNIRLNNLEYQNSNWDFNLAMDIDLSFPDFTDEKLPTIYNIAFTPNGFEFPNIKFNNFSIPNIDFKAFELELYGISIPKFTFDLRQYTPGSVAKMAFEWNVKFSMPNLPNGIDDDFRFPKWDLKATINNGNFNVELPKIDFPNPNGVNIPMPGGAKFVVNAFEGVLNTNYNGSLMSFLPDVKIGGKLTLPEALQCDGKKGELKLESAITLNGNGSISGIIEDVVPTCPINIGLASLYMKKSKIEFKNEDGQKIYLDGKAGIKFTSNTNQKEVGAISVIYEVVNNKVVKAEGEINENFTWDLVGENPTFSFEIEEAQIKEGKLIIDGRSKLKLTEGEELGATFDKFTIDLDQYRVEDGRVIFDDTFAMIIDGIENDEVNFKAVNKGDIPKTENYLYYELPGKISLDKNGFSIQGKSKALLKYQGKELGDLTTEFSNDFAFSLAPFKVARGKCDIFYKKDRVAYFNMDGFFPDPNYFLNRVIPDRIPLPTLEIAYLQIKRDDNLLIDLRTEGNSTRFITRDGEPVELVFPSMQFDLPEAPKILVDFDISIDDVTGEVTDGFIRGVVPEESIPSFDLSRVGIPYTIYSVYYGNIDGINKFRLTGKAKLFDTEVACQDSMTLTLAQNGILEGNVTCDVEKIIPLIPDSDKLNLHINTVSGRFNADLLNVARNFDFELQLDSDVRFNFNENESWGIWTLLGLDLDGLQLLDSRIDDVAIPKIGLEQFKIGIENLNLGRLEYNSTPDADGNSGWDFEFGMDLDLEFPELGMEIPNIPNVILNRTGFHTMNRISVPSFPDSLAFEFEGIQLKPLAFRMPRLNFNWFNPMGGGDGSDWNFDIDFEINFPNIGDGSGAMRYPHLTMLDASFLNGIIIGNVEPINFDLGEGLKLNFGDGFGFSVTEISGSLYDDDGSQGIGFNFNGHMDLPEYMRCDGEETSVDLTDASFSLNSSGHISGVVENFVPRCPIDLGFGHFVVTSSTINFSVADSGQVAILDMTGDLVIDTGDDNTVTANGVLQMNLLTGEIIDGSITIEEQFVWAIPNDKPVLRFTINRAVLDMDGLTIDGESDLLLPGGQTRNAHFRNFKFDYRKYKVKSGSLEIDAGFAIKFAMQDGEIVWTAIPADEPLTENQTAKIGFTSNLTLDVNGLSVGGEAIAAIRWDDDPAHQFGNLLIRYTSDFKFSLRPFMVSEGHADLIHVQGGDETIIATLSHDGLNLGDIFGILPLPEIIPLPTRDIAYLRIKSGNRVLVQSEVVDGNFRIISTAENPAALVIPSLKADGAPVDSIDAIFNIVINPVSLQIVEGEITLVKGDSLSIINLRDRGIPADIFKLHYGKDDEDVYRLTADAQVDLPGIMNGMPIKIRKLRFNDDGLSGNVNLGTYSEEYNDELETIVQTQLGDQAIITLEGVDVSFGNNNTVGFSGKFIPSMLAKGEDITKIQYAANWNQEAGKFNFSFDFEAGEYFDFGIGRFTPSDINDEKPAMKLSLMEDDFELLINGEFKSEEFGSDFAITVEGLKITKSSVSAEAISKPQAHPMEFELFNSQFRIFDKDRDHKAIRFTYNDNVLKLILNGDITLFGRDDKVAFSNLTIGTDGSFSIDEADFLNIDLTIIDNYLALNNLGIVQEDDRYKLAVGGWIKLPEPVGDDTQFDFGFNIAPDGTIIADQKIGNQIVFINELGHNIGGGDQSEYDFWKAKFDVTYLALDLNFDRIAESAVKMKADIYWDNDRNKRVELGDDTTPGLTITFNGNLTWGSASANGSIDFEEDMFKVSISTIQLISDINNNLTFGIGGEFGLNFDAVEGGLELADFQFNKTGIVSVGTITKGSLSIDGVGSLELQNIGYSPDETTIQVNGGEMPGVNGGGASGETQQITVDNYLSFGGQITIDGFGAAGVNRFLSYSTTDDRGRSSNTLIVENAHFEIEDVMSASMDLLYYTGENGFVMRAGGSASIGNFNGAIIGKIAKLDNKVSWGFFFATSMRIDIVPIVITGVGGGFFYNPTANDIRTVKRLANVGTSSGKIEVQGAKFAAFLYGQAAIVSDVLIYGRVLITLTDRQFMLDGKVVLLDMENKIDGEIHLMVQWEPTFEAEGEITVNINVPRLLRGTGRVGFYVYSSDQWAIYGETEMKLFNYLESGSEFFVGNSGFMLGMSSSVNFDLWIIEVGAGIEVKVWKFDTWGAYAKAWVRAEMLWGVAKAKGWLQCALLGDGNNTYLYGQAGLSIHVLFTDWSGSAWAKIANGKVTGGKGSDSDMDALIAAAAGQSAAAEREMNDMKTSIESRPPTVQQFSEEDLLQIYDALAELGKKARYGTRAEQNEAEEFFRRMRRNEYFATTYIPAGFQPGNETTVLPWIQNHVYKGHNAPDLVNYQNSKQSVDSIITIYNDALTEVSPLLEVDFETVEEINNSVAEANSSDPTLATTFARYTIDENGEYQMITSPSMNLDENIVNQNRNSLRNAESEAAQYKQKVARELFKINSNISILENALVGENGRSGLEGTATEYATLITKISDTYKTEFKFSRETELWARSKYEQFNTRHDLRTLSRMIDAKANNLYSNAEWFVLMDLSRQRVFSMNILRGETQQRAFELDAQERRAWDDYHDRMLNGQVPESEYREFAISRNAELGRQLWYDTPREGLEATIREARGKIRRVNSEKIDNLEAMGSTQARFTRRLNRMYYSLSDLSETKYDILTRLIDWEERDRDPYKPATFINQLNQMKTELSAKMEVPTITHLQAINLDKGLYSLVALTWNATGTNQSAYKYKIDYSSTTPQILSSGYQAVGSSKWIRFYYTPNPSQRRFSNTLFKLKARNQVGYEIHKSLSFRPTFTNRNSEFFGDISYHDVERDNTPPVISPILLPFTYAWRPVENKPTYMMMFLDDSSRVEAKWSATDRESGIQEYKYRFISVRNPEIEYQVGFINDNLNLAVLQLFGEQDEDENEPYSDWTSNMGRDNVVINNLNLQHRSVYGLQVVAKNGDGLWSSDTAGIKQYFYTDLTPPTKPTFPFNIGEGFNEGNIGRMNVGRGVARRGYSGVARRTVDYSVNPLISANNLPTDVVAWHSDYDNSDAQIEVSWNEAEDPESGIYRYEIQTTNMRADSITSKWKSIGRNRTDYTLTNTRAFNTMFNYIDSFKVAIRAINYAKRASKTSVKYVKIEDTSPPTKPNVVAYQNGRPTVVGLVFSEPSIDAQSGIDHYEVAVGSEPNGEFDLLSWNDAILINSFNRFGRTNIRIPANNNISYIAVRAVNRDGLKGQLCYTGPFYQDNTRPETPGATFELFNISGRGKVLAIEFTNVIDEESGIKEVRYSLDKKVAGSNGWRPVFNGRTTDNLNGASVYFNRENIGDNTTHLRLTIRSKNNRGLTSYDRRIDYRLPDETPPVTPSVSIASGSINKGQSAIGLTFGNISDPESGIERIEYKIEKRRTVRRKRRMPYEVVSNWRSNGTRTTKTINYSTYSLRSGQDIRVSVRTVNNDGLVSAEQRSTHTLD